MYFKVLVRLLYKLIISGKNLHNDLIIINVSGYAPCIRFFHLFFQGVKGLPLLWRQSLVAKQEDADTEMWHAGRMHGMFIPAARI